jgi:hypothetical protein
MSETCRGKRNPNTVYRRKRIVYQVGNKDKLYWDAWPTKYQDFPTYSKMPIKMCVSKFEPANRVSKQQYRGTHLRIAAMARLIINFPCLCILRTVCQSTNMANINTTTSGHTHTESQNLFHFNYTFYWVTVLPTYLPTYLPTQPANQLHGTEPLLRRQQFLS